LTLPACRLIVLGCVAVALVTVTAETSSAQSPDRVAVQQRLADSRPLTTTEIEETFAVVRKTLAGTTFRITAGVSGLGPEVVLDNEGHIHFLRARANNSVTFSEYVPGPAHYCDGSASPGQLVLEYRQAGSGWTVSTRHSTPVEALQPVFAAIAGTVRMDDAGFTADGGRKLQADWNPQPISVQERLPNGATSSFSTSGAAPGVRGVQALVLDKVSVRPLRWEITVTPPAGGPVAGPITLPYRFEYDSSLDLQPPRSGVDAPDCVELSFGPPGFSRPLPR
jgi:hypothetical protein